MQSALRALLLVALCGTNGCKVFNPMPKGTSPLLPLAAAPDTVTLEVYSAPIPLDDPKLAELWSEVDELAIPPEVRRQLTQNGLRAGLAGPHVSDALAQFLNVTDKPISDEERRRVPLEAESIVALRVRQLQFRKRNELVVSPVYDQISLLRCSAGEVEGKTYQKAECRFDLRVFPESNARIRVELRPQLHHGEFKQRFSGGDGVFRMESLRTIQNFDDLTFGATLGPGQMLLMTSDPGQTSSIGHYFFTQTTGDKPQQKLWVLRVAQAGPDRMFYDRPAEQEAVSSDQDD